MNRKLWLLMTWLLVVPAFVQAASVRGVVVDYETNKPIANVKVAIRNVSAVTDFDGNFELKKVRAGLWLLYLRRLIIRLILSTLW